MADTASAPGGGNRTAADTRVLAAAVFGLTLAAGIALAGWLLAGALYRARAADRFVTVKGLAEREVAANLLIWPIVFTVTDNDLVAVQRKVEEATKKVETFLQPSFAPEEWSASASRIQDRQAQGMGRGEGGPIDRYVAEATVTVRTTKLDVARTAMDRSGDLVKQGVALIQSYEYRTQYAFSPEFKKIRVVTTVEYFLGD